MSTCRTVQPVSSGGSEPARVGAVNWRRLIVGPSDGSTRSRGRGQSRRATTWRALPRVRRNSRPGPVTSSSSSSARATRSASESMSEAGTRWPRMLVPRTRTSVKPASARSVSSCSTSKRRGSGSVLPQRPDGSTRAARAWPNSPAMALAKTTDSRPETSRDRTPPSPSACATAWSVAAGPATERGEGVGARVDDGDVVTGLGERDGDATGAPTEVEHLERPAEALRALVGEVAHGRDDGRRPDPSTSLGALLVWHGILRLGTWYAWCRVGFVCVITLVPRASRARVPQLAWRATDGLGGHEPARATWSPDVVTGRLDVGVRRLLEP